MADYSTLIESTVAYKTMMRDKTSKRLSHAYLLVCPDNHLKDYMQVFAKLIMCESDEICFTCRNCTLIDKEIHPDILVYPKNNKSVLTEDVENIIEESYYKPIEGNKKLFLILNAETMNTQAQNKLLKTLEEPPKNVYILLGALNEQSLLPTIKSRVKKLEIPFFSETALFEFYKNQFEDINKLKDVISLSDGTAESVEKLFLNSDEEGFSVVKDIALNMKTSRDILEFSYKLQKSGYGERFSEILLLIVGDMLRIKENRNPLFNNGVAKEIVEKGNFSEGSLIYLYDAIIECEKRKKANVSVINANEWLLFKILEGKYKWQKL